MNQIDLRSYLLRWSILMKNNFSVAVSLWTLTVKEVRRFLRIWVQTLVPPAGLAATPSTSGYHATIVCIAPHLGKGTNIKKLELRLANARLVLALCGGLCS